MDDLQPQRPTLFQKLLAWAIWGGFSVLFAEIILGSYPFAYFDAWGLLAVCPLYTLHSLVFARIAFWRGPPRFSTLFFAGVLFGLYEAYMTKQLWSCEWNPQAWHVGGVSVIETAVLILWWHPFMAFLVPLLMTETVLCRTRHVARALPEWVKRLLFGRRGRTTLVVLAVLGGLVASSAPNTRPSVGHILASLIPSAAVLLALVGLWRRVTRGTRMTFMDLLPTNRQFVILCVLLGLQYAGLGVLLRREALPGLGPQASIWLLYAVFIGGLWLGLRRPRTQSLLEARDPPDRFSWTLWSALAAVVVTVAVVTRLALGQATWAFMYANLFIGTPIGVATLAYSVYDLLRRRRVP